MAEKTGHKWSGTTGGGSFGQWFLLTVLKKIRVTWLYPSLYFAVPVYCIINHKAFGCIFRYFRNIHHYSRIKSFFKTIQNHLIFGRVVLDRFAILAGNDKQFQIDVPANDTFLNLLSSPGGFMVIGSHIGNFELVGHFFHQNWKRINIVVFGGEKASLQEKRRTSFASHNACMIPVADDMSHIFSIKSALDKGEVVALVCDRIFGSHRTLTTNFFNKPARFPLGTFVLAAKMNVPVIALIVVKQRRTHYKGIIRVLEKPDSSFNSQERAQFYVDQYAHFMESVLQEFPEQWFNFFDFWEDNTPTSSPVNP
ncbi:MAG: lipid A biosynthesis (KDO)2-(lauroyl)-lipid IVA acyltransferase [Bacteroidales bacterium]|nr:lipid A biosynthesis (KDO)2-(lauroyl)-lipid IVA acyltransferase [Bacteroidales bacterium]